MESAFDFLHGALITLILLVVLLSIIRSISKRNHRFDTLIRQIGISQYLDQKNHLISWKWVVLAGIFFGFLSYPVDILITERTFNTIEAARISIFTIVGIPVFAWTGWLLLRAVNLGYIGLYYGGFVGLVFAKMIGTGSIQQVISASSLMISNR